MSDNNYHKLGEAPWFHVVLSTGLGTGFLPLMPGTWGALLALGIWYACWYFLDYATLMAVTVALIVLTTAFGVWTSNVMERYWGRDPRTVNIDEFVGTWIPLLVAPCGADHRAASTWLLAFIGFALFRIIDMIKPLGCRTIDEKWPSGWAVMFDDVLAGTYALIVTLGIKMLFF